MIIKHTPEDFVVEEIYSLEEIKKRDEKRPKPYHYFILTKTNYNQIRALQLIAKAFNTSAKLVHFAGTKDKVGVTRQLISVYGINEENLEKNLEYINSYEGLKLEHIGEFKSRLNLGDNEGNHFRITIRDLEEHDLELACKGVKRINESGVLNLFDEQRFGYANNSHIVGRYLLQNEIEMAVYEIMSSLPNKSQSELILAFNKFIVENWQAIKEQDIETIDRALELTPRYLENEAKILSHLKGHKNDFPGAFRKIHKKLRTLYINAYQSHIFNESLKALEKEGVLDQYEELELVNSETLFDKRVDKIVENILIDDSLTKQSFILAHMPELKIKPAKRSTRIFPRNITITSFDKDDIFEGKFKVLLEFDLDSGEYATNVAKQIFYK